MNKMGIQIKLQKKLTPHSQQDITASRWVELIFEFRSLILKFMFFPIHKTFASNDMYHLNLNYSNI